MHLDIPLWGENIKILKGIGPKRQEAFSKLGIQTLGEVLVYRPHSYTQYHFCGHIKEVSTLKVGTPICFEGEIIKSTIRRNWGKKHLAFESATIGDESDRIGVSWFVPFRGRLPQPRLNNGNSYRFKGILQYYQGNPTLLNPEVEGITSENRLLIPNYNLTKGISRKILINVLSQALEYIGAPYLRDGFVLDPLIEPAILNENIILTAIRLLHQPSNYDQVEWARRVLALVELCQWQTKLASELRVINHSPLKKERTISDRCLDSLPFELTNAQKQAMAEIRSDMQGKYGMRRVLSGDVGSGKTVVIADALLAAVEMHGQAILLVPTRILAKQHYKVLKEIYADEDVNLALVTNDQKDSPQLLEQIALGKVDIVIGTHILLEERVKFARLLVGVIDEQHRFGVEQREALIKGKSPAHILIVSATPIPRTLAQSLYGTLDISVLAEKPLGRGKIETFWILPEKRDDLFCWLAEKTGQGEQVIVICSHIDSDEALNSPGALTIYTVLTTKYFSTEEVALVHGRMDELEQEREIERLVEGKAKVLVATTIVEVGVDIPGATILVVESAHRFGLAQLHQLRGRVGRGDKKGYCFLISDLPTLQSKKRIQAIRTIYDGFELAQLDLKLRGPGEFMGNRQWGLADLYFVDLAKDQDLLDSARIWTKKGIV